MPINQLSTSNTFAQWLTATQGLIEKSNYYEDTTNLVFQTANNFSNVYSNVVNVYSNTVNTYSNTVNVYSNTINVYTNTVNVYNNTITLSSQIYANSYNTANTIFAEALNVASNITANAVIVANGIYSNTINVYSNTVNVYSNTVNTYNTIYSYVTTAYDSANATSIVANNAYDVANLALLTANAAVEASNTFFANVFNITDVTASPNNFYPTFVATFVGVPDDVFVDHTSFYYVPLTETLNSNTLSSLNVTTTNVSATNVSATNVTVTANVSAGNVNATDVLSGSTLRINETISGNNLSATNNVTAGNVNVTNAITSASLTATGTISGNNLSATNNVTAGNVNVTNAITGSSLNITTLTSTGTISGNNVTATNNVSAGNVVVTNAITSASLTATGNASAGNVVATNTVSGAILTATETIFGNNVTATNNVFAGNVVVTNAISGASLTTTGNISGNNLLTTGSIQSRLSSGQDSILLRGRAGGTLSYTGTITPTTLTASRTYTFPDNDGTVLTTGATLTTAQGGTGQTTYSDGQLLIGNSTGSTLTRATLTEGTGVTITNGPGSITISAAGSGGTVTSVGGTGSVNGLTLTGTVTTTGNLTLGGTLTGVNLATQVTGTLPIGNGGTGQTTASAAFNALSPITTRGDLIVGSGTNAATRLGIGSNGLVLTSNGTTAIWAAVSQTYPGAGIAVSTGSAWTTSLTAPTGTVVGTSDTQTLTNKRINPRVSSATSASSLTPDVSAFDQYNYTALAAALTINAPTGTPVDGTKLIFRILDNGTSRALTWNATYTAIGVTLPTATTASKTTYVGCVYNSNNARWDVIAVATQA